MGKFLTHDEWHLVVDYTHAGDQEPGYSETGKVSQYNGWHECQQIEYVYDEKRTLSSQPR